MRFWPADSSAWIHTQKVNLALAVHGRDIEAFGVAACVLAIRPRPRVNQQEPLAFPIGRRTALV
jgi:hypothetical protein